MVWDHRGILQLFEAGIAAAMPLRNTGLNAIIGVTYDCYHSAHWSFNLAYHVWEADAGDIGNDANPTRQT